MNIYRNLKHITSRFQKTEWFQDRRSSSGSKNNTGRTWFSLWRFLKKAHGSPLGDSFNIIYRMSAILLSKRWFRGQKDK